MMTDKLSFALAQLNPTVGDIAGNISKLREIRKKAAAAGAHLVIATELYVSGYPAEDLVLKPSFQKAVHAAVENLAQDTADSGPAILVGAPWRENDRLYNAALLLDGGRIAAKVFKRDLPNYGPFDEKRVFTSAALPEPVSFRGVKLGVLVCEDNWTPAAAGHLGKQGAQILVVPNGSPYETAKHAWRQDISHARIRETGLPLVYVNQVGGQDELVFDGGSFVLDAGGRCMAQAASWAEDMLITHWSRTGGVLAPEAGDMKPVPAGEAAMYHALVLGLRDYVNKNGFPGLLLGLSGGIDSALAAVIAADAIGADRLWTVMLPSPYTS
ncbi:MAG: nitrilase-related carbon-nitrogen hydrolase, partial [Bdellovibrionales bacterium]